MCVPYSLALSLCELCTTQRKRESEKDRGFHLPSSRNFKILVFYILTTLTLISSGHVMLHVVLLSRVASGHGRMLPGFGFAWYVLYLCVCIDFDPFCCWLLWVFISSSSFSPYFPQKHFLAFFWNLSFCLVCLYVVWVSLPLLNWFIGILSDFVFHCPSALSVLANMVFWNILVYYNVWAVSLTLLLSLLWCPSLGLCLFSDMAYGWHGEGPTAFNVNIKCIFSYGNFPVSGPLFCFFFFLLFRFVHKFSISNNFCVQIRPTTLALTINQITGNGCYVLGGSLGYEYFTFSFLVYVRIVAVNGKSHKILLQFWNILR